MLAFHSRVWDKALLKGLLRTQVLTLQDTKLGKVRENPDFTKHGKKKIWLSFGRIGGMVFHEHLAPRV